MDIETVAGYCAVASSVALTCLGLPSQILTTHRLRSVEGLSQRMMIISFTAYLTWFVYGLVKTPSDPFLIYANAPGVLFGGIIVVQIARYRRSGSGE